MIGDRPATDPLAGTLTDPETPRLELSRGVDYARMRGMIASSLFGEPAEPLRIGRFTVLERLGAGGMGVVHAAYDDVLDRKVAVKVLHGAADDNARQRMLREARAMAKLTHPNIVMVHEVGEHEGQVFLAMEFVRGRSLDRWIHEAQERPPWREVLEVFRGAGRGLAAAHGAGLVHRDFKPHNVILGDEGTVKVLDFGLASGAAAGGRAGEASEGTSEEGAGEDAAGSKESDDDSLTLTGALVGTPAYMAPEQFRAEPATAASDQFSFCVSLYEALYGQRPFAGERLTELMTSVLDGRVREPPAGSPVPAWVRAIVGRGLSPTPADRFPSMEALLDALSRDPAVVRRRWLGGGALVALAVGTGLGMSALQREGAVPCEGIATALEETWDDARREAARQGVLGTGMSYAEDTWTRLRPRLDAYAEGWVDAATDACRAHEAGRQSSAIFDLRTVCLESRRASFGAVATRLAGADAGVVERAATMVAGLPSLSRCSELEALTAAVPPPDEPERAEAVARLRETLARARVEESAGRYDAAATLARETMREAEGLDYDPLRAEAALRLGSARLEQAEPEESDARLSEAFFVALGSGHHEVALEALARRIYVRTELQGEPERSREDEPLARALMQRDAGDPHLRWLVANNLGVLRLRLGDEAEAMARFDEALEHADTRGEAGLQDAAAVLANLAYIALVNNDLAEAESRARASLTKAEHALGPEHPQIAFHLYPLGLALAEQGRLAEARAVLERSVAIHEARSGGPSPDVAMELYLLADLARQRREHERGRALSDHGLEIVARTLGPKAPYRIRLLHAGADARLDGGEAEEGLALHREALALAEELFGDEPELAADSHVAIADAFRRLGQGEVARAELQRVLALTEGGQGPDARMWALQVLGELELDEGSPDAARGAFERALAVAEREGFAAVRQARLRRLLGEARLARGELVAAHRSLERAVGEYEASYDEEHPDLARARLSLASALRRCVEAGAECGGGEGEAVSLERAGRLAATAARSYAALGEAFADERRAAEMWPRAADRP